MTGFINKDTPTSDLPLLVCFEAKSIAEKFPKIKLILEDRYNYGTHPLTGHPSHNTY